MALGLQSECPQVKAFMTIDLKAIACSASRLMLNGQTLI